MKDPFRSRRKIVSRTFVCVSVITTSVLLNEAALANCPTPEEYNPRPSTNREQIDSEEIYIESDSMEAEKEGVLTLRGDVAIQQGDREISTDEIEYNSVSGAFKTKTPVQL